MQEHQHTRSRVSLFDCSHMGEFRFRGAEAIRIYDGLVCSDVAGLGVGRCRYGAVLTESGGILDDVITFKMAEDELYVVTNAGPLAQISELFVKGNPGTENVSAQTAKIDVQGPGARDALLALGLEAAATLRYFHACWTSWEGTELLLSRTGYTGELGYELFMPEALAVPLWRALLALEGVKPAGLGARDTLRTEMGYGLSGQDFDESHTPLEAGLASFVAWDTTFRGREALLAQRDRGGYRVLTGIASPDRRAPRHGFEVRADGRPVGEVTSGTFGPSVGRGVGLAYLDPEVAAPGTRIRAGPKDLPVETVELPIYKGGTCRD